MQKRIFIIHGWEGSPNSNWFPWLKENLDNVGIKVEALEMPSPNDPVMSEWVGHIKSAVGEPDENMYLIGHSLGVIAILRYLESLGDEEKIGGVILVAGFPEPIGYEELNSFFETPLDYEKVKAHAKKFIAIHSDNDPYVPTRNGELLRDNLGAELIFIENGGHLNAGDGFFELPIVLEKIKELN